MKRSGLERAKAAKPFLMPSQSGAVATDIDCNQRPGLFSPLLCSEPCTEKVCDNLQDCSPFCAPALESRSATAARDRVSLAGLMLRTEAQGTILSGYKTAAFFTPRLRSRLGSGKKPLGARSAARGSVNLATMRMRKSGGRVVWRKDLLADWSRWDNSRGHYVAGLQ